MSFKVTWLGPTTQHKITLHHTFVSSLLPELDKTPHITWCKHYSFVFEINVIKHKHEEITDFTNPTGFPLFKLWTATHDPYCNKHMQCFLISRQLEQFLFCLFTIFSQMIIADNEYGMSTYLNTFLCVFVHVLHNPLRCTSSKTYKNHCFSKIMLILNEYSNHRS
jgi:hypothetical protein